MTQLLTTRLLASSCLLLGFFTLTGCGPEPIKVADPEPPVVSVTNPIEQELSSFTEFTGRMEAVEVVEIKARVSGYLTKVLFKEGSDVKKGDPLYEIDPRPYKATLDKTEAEIANSQATLTRAKADLIRAQASIGTRAIGQEEFDKYKAAELTAAAALKSAQALRDSAKLDLEFTKILAPIEGRISRTLITEGNLVSPGELTLTKIVSISPIYALWDADEMISLWYRDQILKLKTIPDPRDVKLLKCWIQLKNETGFPHAGYVDYIEPFVVRGTGTRLIRGIFENDEKFLNPGDSIRVRVEAGSAQKVITIPEIAIGSRQKTKFVYVVTDKDEVEFRPVELGAVRDGVQIIEKGLSPTERIIVHGLLRVRPGMKVNPKVMAAGELAKLKS
jgi:RND family efflux transporter MFP subunit